MSWPFPSGGQSVGASVSASVFPMNIQGWFPLGLTGLISFLSKGLSRVALMFPGDRLKIFYLLCLHWYSNFQRQISWFQIWTLLTYYLYNFGKMITTYLYDYIFLSIIEGKQKTTRPFRYDLNQIPYNYPVEVTNRFKELDLLDRVSEELGSRFITLYRRQWSRPSPRKKKAKRLSEETLQIAEKRRKVNGKREKERYTHWMQSSKE